MDSILFQNRLSANKNGVFSFSIIFQDNILNDDVIYVLVTNFPDSSL